jgi:hypothetical protein
MSAERPSTSTPVDITEEHETLTIAPEFLTPLKADHDRLARLFGGDVPAAPRKKSEVSPDPSTAPGTVETRESPEARRQLKFPMSSTTTPPPPRPHHSYQEAFVFDSISPSVLDRIQRRQNEVMLWQQQGEGKENADEKQQ